MIFVIALALAAGGCADAEPAAEGDETTVAASFYPLAFAAEELAGEDVHVENVTPPGGEPHDVELSPRDVERIRDADLVLYLGGGFQPAVERAVEGMPEDRALDLLPAADPRGRDPHVWLDPLRYAAMAEEIGDALDRSEEAGTLAARLRDLDRELEHGLRDCDRRAIVTAHAAFTYLAARYDLEQIAIAGLEPEAEPTARELERLVEAVRGSGATTVFFEPLVSPRVAETVAREADVETATLDPLEGLSEERLAAGADYFGVMRENLEALRAALGCR